MKFMKIINSLLLLATILWTSSINAEVAVYTVDGKFEAVFPSPPQLIGELGTGDYQMRGFNSSDQANLISYTASYQLRNIKHPAPTVEEEIKSFIVGQVLVVKGSLLQQSIGQFGSKPGAQFIISYNHSGIPVRKYGVVIYYDGRFYQWTIQEAPKLSK